MSKVTDLRQARKDRERKAYSDMVLKAFDDMEHQDSRERKEHKAEVERAARQRL